MEFSGKTVLVTGGASGIGRATSLAFGRAGANVVLTYATSEREAAEVVEAINASGGQALSHPADATDADQVSAVFDAARDRFGPVDILVANAGGLLKRSRCIDTDPDFWDQAIALNLTSAFLCCRAALKEMEPRGSGTIVLVASLAAFDGGGPGASHYAAAKGALVSYARALAKEVGPLGIRVNGVAPGLIGTRFHDTFNTPEGRRLTVERTPLRREGTPDDVADAIVFLASPRASFFTGETVQINGGLGLY